MRIVAEDSTIVFSFTTTRFSTGAPYTLAGTPSMYARVDGNATEVTTGLTLTVDFDSKTGENKVSVDLSASASYTAGSHIEFFIAAGTVDSVSAVGIKVYEVLIGTSASLDAAITRAMTALPNAGSGSGSGLATATNVAAVETDTQDIQGRLPASLTGAGNIKADSLAISGDATAADNLETMLDGTGGATLSVGTITVGSNFTVTGSFQVGTIAATTNTMAWSSNWDSDAESECYDALLSIGLDHLFVAADPGGLVVNSSLWAKLHSKSATPAFASYDNTTDSMEAHADAATSNYSNIVNQLDSMETTLNDVPSTAEFEARTLPAADYVIVSDLGTVQSGDGYSFLVANLGVAGAAATEAGGTGDHLTALATQASVNTVSTNVTTLLSRITSTLFSGITSLAQWLGIIAGKQTGNATALTEMRATGAGSGTVDPTTDSMEAIRDRGDAAWTTGGGGGDATAANQTSIINHLVDIKGGGWSSGTDTLEKIRDAIDGVGGAVGPGSEECLLVIKDTAGTPIPDAEVWITNTNDPNDSVVAGTLETNGSGQVTFMLDPGVYYRWAQKAGVNFTNPKQFTVT